VGQANTFKTSFAALVCCGVLGGCATYDLASRAGLDFGGNNDVVAASADVPALNGELANGERSDLIDALLNRRSVLPVGPYSQVADSVLATNSRAAEAELRAAMLRSRARELNWLPSLGPSISLDSLGSVVAGLVIEQTLFDGGVNRAEREFARADVEVAAVALAQDTNDRVYQALDLYLTIQSSNARAEVNEGGLLRMERFEYIMSERVRAGINDRADLQLVQQRLTQMRSDILEDREAAAAAGAELAAMSDGTLEGVQGIETIPNPAGHVQPLDVMQVEAEGTRGLAEARALQAGYIPNVSASGDAADGDTFGLGISIPNGFGFGRGADVAALEALGQAAELAVAEQHEDSAREVAVIWRGWNCGWPRFMELW